MTVANVSVPVINNSIAGEGNEEFDLMLTVSSSLSPGITAGDRNRAKGVIIDSTSKCKILMLKTLAYNYVVEITGQSGHTF